MKSLSLAKPHLLIMAGIPGSGKSFFAEKFSETFNAPFVSYHHLQNMIGNESAATDVTAYMLAEVMKSGQSLLLETKTDTRKERLELARFARTQGYEPLFVWVQTDVETAKSRAARPGKTKTNRILSSEEHERLAKRFTPLVASETHVVISGKHTYASQARVVLTKLSAPRAEISGHSQPPVRPETPGRRNISIG